MGRVSGGSGGGSGPVFKYVTGNTYANANQISTQNLVANNLNAMPFPVYGSHTFTGIGCHVTGAGTAGSLLRMGVYRDSAGYPGALVVDAGTVAGDATGPHQITGLSIPATNEILWLALKGNSLGATLPVVLGLTNGVLPFGPTPSSAPLQGGTWNVADGTTTMPATYPGGGVADQGSWAMFLLA